MNDFCTRKYIYDMVMLVNLILEFKYVTNLKTLSRRKERVESITTGV